MYQQTTGARKIQGRFGLSFFGRTYNNVGALGECKNNGQCVINKKNRTSCKSCRLKKCILVGMSKSGSRYGRRSNWFKIHCLIQDQVESNGRMSSDNQTLLTLANNDANNPNLISNNNNIGSATCTPSPSGHNSNNSSQNNGTISSSNNGSDLLAQYKSSLKETELNSSLNSNKLFNNKISSGQLPYNTLLQEVAKNSFKLNTGTNNKLNGSSNSNGSYPEETDTPPLQTKLNNKFNKNLSHLPLSPVSPLSPFFQNSIFARNLAQAAAAVNSNSTQNSNLSTNNLAAQNSAGLLGSNQNNTNLISSNQNILNNPLYQNNFYQNYQAAAAAAAAAAHLLPLQPLLQNNTNNSNLTNNTANLLNSLTNRNATSTQQQLLQQQLLQQQLEIAGLNNKLFGEKFKKANENQTFGSNIDQDCPIDLSVKNSPLDTSVLTQLCANYNLVNELNGNLEGGDQSTFSPSSSNEENFGLTGHLQTDLNNAQALAAVASLKQTGNLFNNLNLAGLGNLNDLSSLNNLLNLTNNETKEANIDSYKNVLDNALEENSHTDDIDDDNKFSKLQKTLNALTSAKNLIALAQLNPNLLNLNNNNADINSLLSFANNSHLNNLKLQQASAVNKLSQSLDIIRKLDNNLNVQNQSLNRLTSLTSNLSNERKKINSNDLKKQKLVQNKEATKDKNNNEDLIKENKTKNQELNYDQNEDIKEDKSSDEERTKKDDINLDKSDDEDEKLNKKIKKSNENQEFEEENELNKDENSQKSLLSQKNLNENRRKRRKRPSFENTKISEDDIYSDSEQEQAKEINKKVKKEHQTDSETESVQE